MSSATATSSDVRPAGRTILLTGATGFIGAAMAHRLVGAGSDVHLLVRSTVPTAWRLEGVGGRVRYHECDLRDRDGVARVVARVRPTWVFHLAAYGAYPSQRDVSATLTTNIEGTVNLLDAVADVGVEAFVNAGSSSEYGFKDHAPVEDEAPEPNSEYAVAKAAATAYCELRRRRDALPVSTLRLYSVFGPWEEPTRLLPTLAVLGLAGSLPPLVGPSTARDFVYVDDVVDAFLRTAAQPQLAGTYNIGSGVQTTLDDLVRLVRAQLHVDVEPRWHTHEARTWDTEVWRADAGRARAVLGWAPARTLAEGFGELVAWLTADERVAAHYRARVRPAGEE